MVPIARNSLSDPPPDLERTTTMSRLNQIAPESAIKFAAYDTFKRLIKGDADRDIQIWERFLAGSLAGGVSQSTIYPLEVGPFLCCSSPNTVKVT